VLGRIVAPFGVRGWVRVYSYTDPPDALLQHRRWQLRKPGDDPGGNEQDSLRTLRVLQGQWDGNVLRAQLDGIEDRDAAEGLREWEILIARSALPAAAEREYYREDLLGFTVRNREGAVLGELQHFLETPASPVMVVKGEREYTVPAEPAYLKRVDLDRREIEVEWPADF
jgi:16S rRNA processing protein RimM